MNFNSDLTEDRSLARQRDVQGSGVPAKISFKPDKNVLNPLRVSVRILISER